MNHLIHGNLGYSYKVNQSVAALFRERWARSAYLSGISLLLAVLIAVPLGIYQAVKRNTVGDTVVTSLAFTTYAMPVFFLALILIQVFALTFPIFSFEASQSLSVWQRDRRLALDDAPDRHADAAHRWQASPGTCARPRSTRWPRTTSRPPARRACPSGWC